MLVRRGEGIISLKPVIEEVKGVRRAADHTAAELALVRIQKEIDELIIYRDSLPAPDNDKSSFTCIAIFLFFISFVLIGASKNPSNI